MKEINYYDKEGNQDIYSPPLKNYLSKTKVFRKILIILPIINNLYKKNKIYIILLLGLILFIAGCSSNNQDWQIEGDTIFIDNSNVKIEITPHTLYSDGNVIFNLTSKQYTGNIDIYFGFDTDVAQPQEALLFNPQTIQRTRTFTCNPPYWFNYTLSPRYVWCWNNITTGDINNGSLITIPTLVFETDYDIADLQTRTAIKYYYENVLWQPFNNRFNKVNYNYQGMNIWYYTNNLPIQAGREYSLKVYIKTKREGDIKYWVAIKPSGETLDEAITNNHFYYLDPWINASKNKYINITFTNTRGYTWREHKPIFISLNETTNGTIGTTWIINQDGQNYSLGWRDNLPQGIGEIELRNTTGGISGFYVYNTTAPNVFITPDYPDSISNTTFIDEGNTNLLANNFILVNIKETLSAENRISGRDISSDTGEVRRSCTSAGQGCNAIAIGGLAKSVACGISINSDVIKTVACSGTDFDITKIIYSDTNYYEIKVRSIGGSAYWIGGNANYGVAGGDMFQAGDVSIEYEGGLNRTASFSTTTGLSDGKNVTATITPDVMDIWIIKTNGSGSNKWSRTFKDNQCAGLDSCGSGGFPANDQVEFRYILTSEAPINGAKAVQEYDKVINPFTIKVSEVYPTETISSNPLFSAILNSTNVLRNDTNANLTITFINLDSSNDMVNITSNWYENETRMMVLNLPFDTNLSYVQDYSELNNNGNLVGINQNMTWESGINCKGLGGCYTFIGFNTSFINVTTSSFGLNISKGNFTVEYWFKGRQNFGSPSPRVVTMSNNGGTATVFEHYFDNQFMVFSFITSTLIVQQSTFERTPFQLQNNVWYHVAWVVNDTGKGIWINGTFIISNNSNDRLRENSPLTNIILLNSNILSNRFNGSIAEFRIWNRTLTPNQIYQNYLAGLNNKTIDTLVDSETTIGYTYRAQVTVANLSSIGNLNFSTNNITILSGTPPTPPILNSPNNNYMTTNYTVNLSIINSNDFDNDIINYEFYMDRENSIPTTLVGDTIFNETNVNLSQDGRYYWRVRAKDKDGISDYSNINTFLVDRRLITSNITTISSSVIEGANESYRINITINDTTTKKIDALFTYDTFNNSVTITNEGNNRYSFYTNLLVPITSGSPITKNYFWLFNLTLINGTNVHNSSFSGSQLINPRFLQFCNELSTSFNSTSAVAINFTFYDEINLTRINSNISLIPLYNNTFQGNFIHWTNDRNSNKTTLIKETPPPLIKDTTSIKLCITPPNIPILVDASIIYDADGYDARTYYYEHKILDNQTDEVGLYLLDFNLASEVTFTIKDENGDGFKNALLIVDRKYQGEGIYRTVAIGKTGTDGKVNIFLRKFDSGSIYRFTVQRDGITYFQTVDTSLTASEYEISISPKTFSDILNQINEGVSHSGINFNNNTKTFTIFYNSSINDFERACLSVVMVQGSNENKFDEDCSSLPSNTLRVSLGNASANYFAKFNIELKVLNQKTPLIKTLTEFQVDLTAQKLGNLIGETGLIIGFFLILGLALLGSWKSPSTAIILSMFGILILSVAGIWILGYWAIIGILISLGIIIWRLRE